MKKNLFVLFAIILSAFSGFSQDEAKEEKPWKVGGKGMLTFSQVALSNWAAGGQSNMTLIGNLSLYGNYKKGTTTWDNKLELSYGFIKNDYIYNWDNPVIKAEDLIDLTSKYGKKAWSEKFYYSGLLNIRSQFAPGYSNFTDPRDQYISKFASPIYGQIGFGLDYKPNKNLSFLIAPLTGKFTFVGDTMLANAGAFGVNSFDPKTGDRRFGSTYQFRGEFGWSATAKFKKDWKAENDSAVLKDWGVESQLDLFGNYIDRPGNIDIRWRNTLVMHVTKYLTVNFLTDMIYDNDVRIGILNNDGLPIDGNGDLTSVSGLPQKKGPRLQIKEVFGIGLTYNFAVE